MKSIKKMSMGELGAYVQSHLRDKGIEVVLSGGAVVGIYSGNKYVSKDLDFINVFATNRRTIRAAMEEIGFREDGRYFTHPDTEFFIEFPAGPLAIGSEPIHQVVEKEFSTGKLELISPTDCVKDRLAAYYHWGDRQCLLQAQLVANENPVDLEEIKRWSNSEEKQEEFERIKDQLGSYSK
jgi:hypothetical protein